MATPPTPRLQVQTGGNFFGRRGGDAAANEPVDLHTTYPFQIIALERQEIRRGVSVYRPDGRRNGRGIDQLDKRRTRAAAGDIRRAVDTLTRAALFFFRPALVYSKSVTI
tara:strand:+ start:3401 stop:3730 length:330 start_codon:yes stop_codon:yes gene_type:complete